MPTSSCRSSRFNGPMTFRQIRRWSSRGGEDLARRRGRYELFRAGVVRMPPIEVPATKKGMRTDLGKRGRFEVRAEPSRPALP